MCKSPSPAVIPSLSGHSGLEPESRMVERGQRFANLHRHSGLEPESRVVERGQRFAVSIVIPSFIIPALSRNPEWLREVNDLQISIVIPALSRNPECLREVNDLQISIVIPALSRNPEWLREVNDLQIFIVIPALSRNPECLREVNDLQISIVIPALSRNPEWLREVNGKAKVQSCIPVAACRFVAAAPLGEPKLVRSLAVGPEMRGKWDRMRQNGTLSEKCPPSCPSISSPGHPEPVEASS